MKFPVIYEDKNCIVIDKPDGIVVHPDGRGTEFTVSDWMREEYNAFTDEEGRNGIVHRLDRNTTGVLLLAKTSLAFNMFKRQFKAHSTRKVYRAIVEGRIKDDYGMIAMPLARAKSDFRKKTVVDLFTGDARGEEREAITRYKVLERVSHDGKPYSYVEVYPVTGRTHQIRAHMRAIRHPIVGDDLYGSRSGKHEAVRSMLHAYSLTINIPDGDVIYDEETGETKSGSKEMIFKAPIHKDMQETLAKLGFNSLI